MSIFSGSTARAVDVLTRLFWSGNPGGIFRDQGGLMNNNFSTDVAARAYVNGTTFILDLGSQSLQKQVVTSDWASATGITGCIIKGGYVYLLLIQASGAPRLYRYTMTNVSGGGTLMTFSGQTIGSTAAIAGINQDGAGNFYFTNKAGGSTSNHIISKYSLSGTTLTYISDITCGSTSSNFGTSFVAVNSSYIWALSSSDSLIRKYNTSGTLVATSVTTYVSGSNGSTGTINFNDGTSLFVYVVVNSTGGGQFYTAEIILI